MYDCGLRVHIVHVHADENSTPDPAAALNASLFLSPLLKIDHCSTVEAVEALVDRRSVEAVEALLDRRSDGLEALLDRRSDGPASPGC